MRSSVGFVEAAVVLSCALSVVACDDSKQGAAAGPSATAVAPPTPASAPAPDPEPRPEPKKPARPEKVEVQVTPERRAKVEAAVPEAKGFLAMDDLEGKLKANKKLKEKSAGVAALDKLAAGKWVLFTGPVANLTDSGFDLGVTYTPQIPGDVMGMSRQWFPVTFSDVKGYAPGKFKAGDVVVVLARYGGKQKAGPGQELVEAGTW